MTFPQRPPAVLRTAFIAAASLFAMACDADSAFATCGDYLTHGVAPADKLGGPADVTARHADHREGGAPACRDGSCPGHEPDHDPAPSPTWRVGDLLACREKDRPTGASPSERLRPARDVRTALVIRDAWWRPPRTA